MTFERPIVKCRADGTVETWVPKTLDQLGKTERFLEEALARSPALLGLESIGGITRPLVPFRQVSFETPQGRSIAPDIVLLAASGHVIVVEVKLFKNPELRDRRVIAQIVDYAASFAALKEGQLQTLLMKQRGAKGHWSEFVQGLFPGDPRWEELADVFVRTVKGGKLNLVIACDRAPAGLAELVAGVTAQSALEFQLDLVEVVSYVAAEAGAGDILFAPNAKLSTEIVTRAAVAVTVHYRQSEMKPSVEVPPISWSRVKGEGVVESTRTEGLPRIWTEEQTVEAFENGDDPVQLELLEFARTHSFSGRILAPGLKVAPSFGLYLYHQAPVRPGASNDHQLFRCSLGSNRVTVYLNMLEERGGKPIKEEFANRLTLIFGSAFDPWGKEPKLTTEDIGAHLDEFKEAVLWLKDALATGTSS